MNISCASLFLWEYSIHDIMEILFEAGIGSIEFWAETPFFWRKRNDENTIASLVEEISMMPHGCTLHAPILDLNPSSYNELVHEATVRETLWSLELGDAIGARMVTIHPGKRTVHRTPTNEDWDKFMKYLKVTYEKANTLDIPLALENSTPDVSSMCSSPQEMKEVLNRFPGLFFTLDVVHAYLDSPKTAFSFIGELCDRIINVHIGAAHDGVAHYPTHREKKMERVLRRLRDSGYRNDLTIEIDDKVYSKPLSREDKVKELIGERTYLESIFL